MNTTRFALLLGMTALVGCPTADDGSTDDDTAFESGDTALDTDTDVDTDTDTDTDVVDLTPMWNTDEWTTDWTDAIDCDTNNEVTISASTTNWGYDAAMYISQTRFYGEFSAWDELHTLAEVGQGGDANTYSDFARTLTTGATAGTQTDDTSTLWKCNSAPSLNPDDTVNFQTTWALAVWGEDDDPLTDAPADCIVFGQDPSELLDDASGNGRTPPAWLSSTNCRNVNPTE